MKNSLHKYYIYSRFAHQDLSERCAEESRPAAAFFRFPSAPQWGGPGTVQPALFYQWLFSLQDSVNPRAISDNVLAQGRQVGNFLIDLVEVPIENRL